MTSSEALPSVQMSGSGANKVFRRGDSKGVMRSSVRDNRRLSVEEMPGGGLQRMNTHRYIKGTTIEKPVTYEGNAMKGIMLHPMNVLLIFLPLGTVAYFGHWDDTYIFWFNFFAMIPLAKILGDATEELAASLKNDMIAGLLNATFGNAVEMVITVKTLNAGLYDVVKSTLLGSVLSNTLLVLGMSFLCGGLVTLGEKGAEDAGDEKAGDYKSLAVDPTASSENVGSSVRKSENGRQSGMASSLRASAASAASAGSEGEKRKSNKEVKIEDTADTTEIAKDDPGRLDSADSADAMLMQGTGMYEDLVENFDGAEKIQNFSVLGALVNTSMLLISCMSFSLITVFRQVSHREGPEEASYMEEVLLPVSRIASIIIIMAYVAYTVFQLVTHKAAMADGMDGDDDDDEEHMSATKACMLLFGTTVIVSLCTEMLVHAIGGVTENAHISKHFIGIILLPIVGNACEHAAAVRFAMQDKLGLSVSIAVGSSTQIALFVVPFSVLAGWAADRPMDLNFGTLSTSMITLSVVVVLSMVVDGQSNWLQGYLLCSVYAIIAVMYWYLPDELHDSLNPAEN